MIIKISFFHCFFYIVAKWLGVVLTCLIVVVAVIYFFRHISPKTEYFCGCWVFLNKVVARSILIHSSVDKINACPAAVANRTMIGCFVVNFLIDLINDQNNVSCKISDGNFWFQNNLWLKVFDLKTWKFVESVIVYIFFWHCRCMVGYCSNLFGTCGGCCYLLWVSIHMSPKFLTKYCIKLVLLL